MQLSILEDEEAANAAAKHDEEKWSNKWGCSKRSADDS